MNSYQRLTLKERYQIELLVSKDLGVRTIARTLKMSPSTICRELKKVEGKYTAERAEEAAQLNQKRRTTPRFKIKGNLKRLVDRNLLRDLSPEQLSKALFDERAIKLSYHSIYRYIERDRLKGGRLKYQLRILRKLCRDRKRPQYQKCLGLIRDRVPISERPKVVLEKSRIGDFERDTVLGKRGGPLFLTIVERKSGYAFIRQVRRLNAESIHRATVKALRGRKVETITNDNGIEFAFHKRTAKALKTKIYFSRSYAAWERGANENFNGLLRQYFPRKTHIPELTSRQLRSIELRLNTRPRKRLGFKTPYEIYHGKPHGRVLR